MDSQRVIAHHYSIRNRYNTINDCLRMVKGSQLSEIDRIKIETMLIRMKVILLGHSGGKENAIVDDDAFAALRHQIETTCGAGEKRLLPRLFESISALATALEQEADAAVAAVRSDLAPAQTFAAPTLRTDMAPWRGRNWERIQADYSLHKNEEDQSP